MHRVDHTEKKINILEDKHKTHSKLIHKGTSHEKIPVEIQFNMFTHAFMLFFRFTDTYRS